MSSDSSGTLVPLMLASLPHAAADARASPDLRSPWDALALLCHACLLSVDFRLIGLGEDDKIETSSDATAPKPLPAAWNTSASSDYAFRYKHPQSQLEYLLKIGRLGGKAVVSGMGVGDDRVRSFDVTVRDYASESSFPFSRTGSDADDQTKQALTDLFISHGRIADFSALFKLRIIQALVPGLHKPGYEETPDSQAAGRDSASTTARSRDDTNGERRQPPPAHDPLPPLAQPRPYGDPLAEPLRRPLPPGDFPPPGFEDEYEILRPPRAPGAPGGWGGPGMPTSGERDLYPPGLGPSDPLRIGPRGGGGGGGMHPNFDDPMFGGSGGAGEPYDHRAPPGARYDPIGPFDGPPNLRGGPRGPGGRFGGGPPNPFGGFGSGDFI